MSEQRMVSFTKTRRGKMYLVEEVDTYIDMLQSAYADLLQEEASIQEQLKEERELHCAEQAVWEERLEKAGQELEDTKRELEAVKQGLDGAKCELEDTKSELEEAKSELEGVRQELALRKAIGSTRAEKEGIHRLKERYEEVSEQYQGIQHLLEVTGQELEESRAQAFEIIRQAKTQAEHIMVEAEETVAKIKEKIRIEYAEFRALIEKPSREYAGLAASKRRAGFRAGILASRKKSK